MKETKVLSDIDHVFESEIETLIKVRKSLSSEYIQAIELLSACSGHVVITGTGKSGLVAQKIVATMVSTGTPAVFLHPGDAMHGDAGIIRKGDVVISISKSGETNEVLSLLPYVRELGIPVICITAEPKSSLANESDLILFTPVDKEACPLNLAPTSSTTAAMVVGDALAMALMQMHEFKADNYAMLHPGGQLGRRLLLRVADVMRGGQNNPIVNVHSSVQEMLSEITSKLSGAVSVTNKEGELVGLVTDHDIRTVLASGENIFSFQINEIMNAKPTYIRSNAKAIQALDIMENRERPFVVLPVLAEHGNEVVGMLHLHDLIAQGL